MPRKFRPAPESHRVSVPGVTCPTDEAMEMYRNSLRNFDALPEEARRAIKDYGDQAIDAINMGFRDYNTIVMVMMQKKWIAEPIPENWETTHVQRKRARR